ncbi:hypothetical protein ACH4RA_20740 [Streptomyces smyrnaeus]|uniref:hypothetical protein n=1 Tax=Streptomyces TaxID=1883 RepID=UPI000C1883D0|nr:hypothetical protein [Streptomyces sp. RK75]MBQ0867093.1 hypothetical protein [Streptomyces sp. RK75]MBQ1157664.1 hypothetical protein [Streptomyces sp. A73]
MGTDAHSALPLVGTVVAEGFARWSPELKKEFDTNAHNGRVGQTLLKETDALRIWETHLQPGERITVHRHVLDYFWIALTSGRARQHNSDGTTREISYSRGRTQNFCLAEGRYHLHDLKNIGDDVLSFLTIETKGDGNQPVPLL